MVPLPERIPVALTPLRSSSRAFSRRCAAVAIASTFAWLPAAAATAAADASMYASPGRLVTVRGHQINLYCTGRGSNTVVLEAGLGGRASTWLAVQSAIRKAQVCSYDRAGYGFSDVGPEPRTSQRIADELFQALRTAGIAPPYVLAGASFGAFDVRLFAHDHAATVAAVVLLNPAHEDEELQPAPAAIEKIDRDGLARARRCLDGARRGLLSKKSALRDACVPPPNAQYSDALNRVRRRQLEGTAFWSALVSEWSHIRESAAQVKARAGRLGSTPLVVVSAGKNVDLRDEPADVRSALTAFWPRWVRWQNDLAGLSTRSVHIRTSTASRNVETTDPHAAVDAIERAIARRAEGGGPAPATVERDLHAAIGAWRAYGSLAVAAPPHAVAVAALAEQRLVLAAPPGLPPALASDAYAYAELARLTPPRPLSAFHVGPASSPAALVRYYGEAERRFGVDWRLLAAVNFVESDFGRLRNNSVAGAQGPMQFIPSTWRAYGLGGDVRDPHDAILGAANYLHASGARTDERRALYAYNPSSAYVDAVERYAARMRADRDAFLTYWSRQLIVRTPHGLRRLTSYGL